MRTGRPRQSLPDIVFAGERSSAALSDAVRRGRMVRVGAGVYSTLPTASQEDVVRRNAIQIVDHKLPHAIVADRSVRHRRGDVLYVVHPTRRRPLELTGLTIIPRSGLGALDGDFPVNDSVLQASTERTMLESLAARPSARYLSREEVELWIDEIIRNAGVRGEERINHLRDRARQRAQENSLEPAFDELDSMIGAALSTRPASGLISPALRARAAGRPVDQRRIDLFELFVERLVELAPEPLPVLEQDRERRRLLPFYEAYFSNYIEGTEFTLDEAAEIVFDQRVPPSRPADAHDILGAYAIVSNEREMARTPHDPDEFLDILTSRHRVLLAGRPNMSPGQFKTRNNQAGSTLFVAPDLVEATLATGLAFASRLLDPFARGVYVSFLVSEIHPFADGNGRLARVMLNAELSAQAQARVIIPTVYRNEYISALKAATHNAAFDPIVAVLRFAQRWTARVDFGSRQSAEADLMRTDALRDSSEAQSAGVSLTLPRAVAAASA